MPPSRRPKRGLQRIDAAFDALIPLGFSKNLIRDTIKNLLKVYGGDEGWVFIEEASYKLVIDAILEQQQEEEKEEEENNMMEIEEKDVDTPMAHEMNQPVFDGGDTNLHPEIMSQGLQYGMDEFSLTSGGLAGGENGLPAAIGHASPRKLLIAAGAADQSKLNVPDRDSSLNISQRPNLSASVGGAAPICLQRPTPQVVTGDDRPSSLQQPDEVPRRRRPPCYGWISESESEEE